MKKIALIGTGRIGSHHARTIADEVKGVELALLADPMSPNLQPLAEELGVAKTTQNPLDAASDDSIDAVVICTPAATHPELIEAFCAAGKDIFVEKPLGVSVEDARKAVEASKKASVKLQIGFNRRYADSWQQGKKMLSDGKIGQIHRLHSMTRDPGPYKADPEKIPAGTVFNETLIHDFDTICWLNEGSEPVEVYAAADALVAPDYRDDGFQDSAVVTIRFDNRAIATAEASFCAMYGYDLRGEAFGSKGMVQMGSPENTNTKLMTSEGACIDTSGTDTGRFHESYRREFQAFADMINGKDVKVANGEDGLRAQLIAAAAIKSAKENRPVKIEEVK